MLQKTGGFNPADAQEMKASNPSDVKLEMNSCDREVVFPASSSHEVEFSHQTLGSILNHLNIAIA